MVASLAGSFARGEVTRDESAEQLRDELHAADLEQSRATAELGSAEGFTAALADDAVLMLSGRYAVWGRTAIAQRLAVAPLEVRRGVAGVIRWEPLRWDVGTDGRLGYSAGRVLLDVPGADGVPFHYWGAYLATWVRGADGVWRVAAWTFSLTGDQSGAGAPPLADLPPGFASSHRHLPHCAASPGGVIDDPRCPDDDAAALAEVFAADQAFSAESDARGVAAAFVEFAAPDAYLMGGSGSFGQDDIRKAYREPVPVAMTWAPVTGRASSTGDLAYSIGQAITAIPVEGGPPLLRYSKYLTIWMRQPGGEWRYVTDAGNGSPGPDGP